MSQRLPRGSWRKAVRAFEKEGWRVTRQRGSHMILEKPGCEATLSIPRHDTIGPGLLRSLIRDAGMTVEEFLELYG